MMSLNNVAQTCGSSRHSMPSSGISVPGHEDAEIRPPGLARVLLITRHSMKVRCMLSAERERSRGELQVFTLGIRSRTGDRQPTDNKLDSDHSQSVARVRQLGCQDEWNDQTHTMTPCDVRWFGRPLSDSSDMRWTAAQIVAVFAVCSVQLGANRCLAHAVHYSHGERSG